MLLRTFQTDQLPGVDLSPPDSHVLRTLSVRPGEFGIHAHAGCLRNRCRCECVINIHTYIHFASKKQNSVALSSAHAEIVALSEAAKDCVYFQRLSDEICPPATRPMTLATDNTAARDLAYNPEHHERTKHIARRHYYIREVVEEHRIRVPFVRSHENLADFFTKHLPPKVFFGLRRTIMNLLPP